MTDPVFIPAVAVASCLGSGKAATWRGLFDPGPPRFRMLDLFGRGKALPLGALDAQLPPVPPELSAYDSRNNRLLMALAGEIRDEIAALVARHGRDRIAIVLGTSTSGIAEGEQAVAHRRTAGVWPESYHYVQQEAGSPAAFLARALNLSGPAYVVATACSSSAKVFASARRLMRLGIVDAAIVGGADTLCQLTVAGFGSLEAVSARPCNPFSANRDGITIGEGGALFLLTPEPSEIALLGAGESSDAHHVSAPEPEGRGAREAMALALADAGLDSGAIGYVNLHGTATVLNDSMEAKAVAETFGKEIPCSATKALTGHTLGAAGAVEAAIVWLTMHGFWNPQGMVPPHRWDGVADPALPAINLAGPGTRLPAGGARRGLSSSFAFGGSNCALILGTTEET